MAELKTLNDIFLHAASRGSQTVALTQPKGSDDWQPVTANHLYHRVRRLASWLRQQGFTKGDRIALIAENRWEWAVTDFASLAIGAVDVPLFPTITAEQTAVQLADSGATIVFVSTPELAKKVDSIRQQTAIKTIVVMDDPKEATETQPHHRRFFDLIDEDGGGCAPDHFSKERDSAFDESLRSAQPADLATIIYTSGTTGDAKGVMLTHGNLASNVTATTQAFAFLGVNDSCISFLPLSHVTARHVDYLLYNIDVTIAYVARVERLLPAIQQIKPTVFIAVPRVYERIRQSVESKSSASPLKAKIFRWAIKQGTANRKYILVGRTPGSLLWKLANKLVFSKISEAFGGRVRAFVAGGAPLGFDLAAWFADAGLRILEGYGLTETSPVIGVNLPSAHRIGTVGKTMPNIECRIAEDGELLVRGPSVFVGYWEKPEATAAVFDEEGFFRTGDIGNIDPDGYLSITDRKRELIKTSNGKFIAPQPIENKLKVSALFAHAVLFGDKRKYISLLIAPNFVALEEWGKRNNFPATTRDALLRDPKVQTEFQQEIDRVNATLAPYEKIKRFRIVPDEWSIDGGELTPSMKLKRRIIASKYASEIAGMYGSETEE